MKIIFWQNIISPHLSYFLSEVGQEHEVILIVDSFMSKERHDQGWAVPVLENVDVIRIKDLKHAEQLSNQYKDEKNVFNGFSGMNLPPLQAAFKHIIKHSKVVILSESPIQLGPLKYLRKCIYTMYFLKYHKNISHIFAMGNLGVNWFREIGFSDDKITPFCYFIEPADVNDLQERELKSYKEFIFVGQLIDRKGLDNLLKVLQHIDKNTWRLQVIGKGEKEQKLKDLAERLGLQANVQFLGTKANAEVRKHIAAADYLILPSRFDGWGAVVSEALSLGVKVICSDRCGASILVSKDHGYVYAQNRKSSLLAALEGAIGEKTYNREVIRKSFVNYTQTKIKQFSAVVKNI